MNNLSRFFFAGDCHGNFSHCEYLVRECLNHDLDVIYQVGDFGFFEHLPSGKKFLDHLQKLLEKNNITLRWIDGNHECVSEDTKAVTRKGLKYYHELSFEDQVMSVDDKGNSIWIPIEEIITKEYSGDMIQIEGRGVDAFVTPNHRIVGWSTTNETWKEYLAKDLHTDLRILVAGRNNREGFFITDEKIKVAAWCLTDSHINSDGRWTFYQAEGKHKQIVDLLHSLGISPSTTVRQRDIAEICGKKLKTESQPSVEIRISAQDSKTLTDLVPNKNQLPEWISFLSKRQFDIFLKEYQFCDGTTPSAGTSIPLYISRDELRTQLQLVAIQNGYRTSTDEYRDGHWRLNLTDKSFNTIQPKYRGVTQRKYSGIVWCLKVPNGRFFVERNGKIHLTGNCHPLLRSKYNITGPGSYDIRPNIIYQSRGSFLNVNGIKLVFCGGAPSIDKDHRTPGSNWWPEEEITITDINNTIDNGKDCDILITHDAPLGDYPMNNALNEQMHSTSNIRLTQLFQESYNSRKAITGIVESIKPRILVHGHMHFYHSDIVHYADHHQMKVLGLDRDGTGVKSWEIVTIASKNSET